MSRRQARESALQVLYQIDMSGTEPRRALGLFWQSFEPPAGTREFATELVEGTYKERERLDRLIAEAAEHWRIGRLPKVELNLLRMGVYELLSYPHISANVTINEAIEIARLYCGDDAPTFINGVLDRVAAVIGKKAQADESKQ
jgi:transcription antitermination protein NusB